MASHKIRDASHRVRMSPSVASADRRRNPIALKLSPERKQHLPTVNSRAAVLAEGGLALPSALSLCRKHRSKSSSALLESPFERCISARISSSKYSRRGSEEGVPFEGGARDISMRRLATIIGEGPTRVSKIIEKFESKYEKEKRKFEIRS